MFKNKENIIDASHVFYQKDSTHQINDINDYDVRIILESLHVISQVTNILYKDLLNNFYYKNAKYKSKIVTNDLQIYDLLKLAYANSNIVILLYITKILSSYLIMFKNIDNIRNCRFHSFFSCVSNYTKYQKNQLDRIFLQLQQPNKMLYLSYYKKSQRQNIYSTENILSILRKQTQGLIISYLPNSKKILYVENYISYAKQKNFIKMIYDFTSINILPLLNNKTSTIK